MRNRPLVIGAKTMDNQKDCGSCSKMADKCTWGECQGNWFDPAIVTFSGNCLNSDTPETHGDSAVKSKEPHNPSNNQVSATAGELDNCKVLQPVLKTPILKTEILFLKQFTRAGILTKEATHLQKYIQKERSALSMEKLQPE